MKKTSEKKYTLWAIIKPVIVEIRVSIFLSILAVLSLITTLIILSLVLSSIINGTFLELFGIEFNLFNTILLLACITIISFVSRLYSFVFSHLAAFKLEQLLRTSLSEHLVKVPLGYIISNGSGSLKKAMKEDVRALHFFVADSIPLIAKSILAPFITLLILLIIDYRLALVSISVLIFGLVIITFAMKDFKEFREKYEYSLTNINKAVIEFSQAMPVVRTFDDGTSSFIRYNNALFAFKENLYNWMKSSAISSKLGMIIFSPLPTLLAIIISGVIFFNNSTLNLFAFIVALFLSTSMVDSIMQIMWLQNFLKKARSSAFRIQEILEEEVLCTPLEPKTPYSFDIEFKNVFFKYNITENYTLKKIDFKVKQGSFTALVGPSGAGKSTIAKLIPRFWDISKGEILIGNVNIKDIDSQTLMNIVSFVFQETFLFHDTIYNNIKIANKNSTKDDVFKAAKAAQIHNFIESLPNGYETMIKEKGTNISGGQKQRITIARAILRNTPIVVLDEATAFADSQNEEKILKALSNLTVNKTVIMVAHRLSTIKDADQIIVFDKGEIIEIGKHNELLENGSVYKKLWMNYQKANCWNFEKRAINE